jgi:hypothetical protein
MAGEGLAVTVSDGRASMVTVTPEETALQPDELVTVTL